MTYSFSRPDTSSTSSGSRARASVTLIVAMVTYLLLMAGLGDPWAAKAGRTLAEVDDQEKLAVAHRGVAFRQLREYLNRHAF